MQTKNCLVTQRPLRDLLNIVISDCLPPLSRLQLLSLIFTHNGQQQPKMRANWSETAKQAWKKLCCCTGQRAIVTACEAIFFVAYLKESTVPQFMYYLHIAYWGKGKRVLPPSYLLPLWHENIKGQCSLISRDQTENELLEIGLVLHQTQKALLTPTVIQMKRKKIIRMTFWHLTISWGMKPRHEKESRKGCFLFFVSWVICLCWPRSFLVNSSMSSW